jgi:hypothetical protein
MIGKMKEGILLFGMKGLENSAAMAVLTFSVESRRKSLMEMKQIRIG